LIEEELNGLFSRSAIFNSNNWHVFAGNGCDGIMKALIISIRNGEAFGPRSIHAYLIGSGIHADLLFMDHTSDESLDTMRRLIALRGYTHVGVSAVSPTWADAKRILTSLKGLVVRIVGGWQPTLSPDECYGYAEHVVQGQGEEAMVQIMRGQIRSAPTLKTISTVPRFSSSFCQKADGSVVSGDPYANNERYGTFLSLGCPMSCSYCSNNSMKKIYPDWNQRRVRAICNVKAELLTVMQRFPSISRINFYDEVFYDPGDDFLRWYKDAIGLPFYVMFYPGTCNRRLVERLKDAGLAGVWVGVQSGSDDVRKSYGRHYSNESVIQQGKMFAELGVSVRYDLILENPWETEEQVIETANMMLNLPWPCSFNLFSLRFYPGSAITEKAINSGICVADSAEGDFVLHPKNPTTKLIAKIAELACNYKNQ
jgi:radical SAM superfamily enzyme YgiQ (UPF0313 family)